MYIHIYSMYIQHLDERIYRQDMWCEPYVFPSKCTIADCLYAQPLLLRPNLSIPIADMLPSLPPDLAKASQVIPWLDP